MSRRQVVDGVIVVAVLLTAVFLALSIDIVRHQGGGGDSQRLMLEVDEALGVGVLVIILLLIYGFQRLNVQRRELQARLNAEIQAKRALQLALLDPLTGVANRRHFQDSLNAASNGRRGTNALFMLDMDGFKAINDTYGHPAGDEVLKAAAARLQVIAGKQNLVSRLGGDEFAVLVFNIQDKAEAESVRDRIREEIERPISANGQTYKVGVSIGMSVFPEEGRDAAQILARTDDALYQDKRRRQLGFQEPQPTTA